MKFKFRSFLIRTLWGTLIALFLIFIFHFFDEGVIEKFQDPRLLLMAFWIILFVNLLFHGVLWLDRRLDRSIPWFYFPKKRLFTELAIAIPASLMVTAFNYFLMYSFSSDHNEAISHQRFLYAYIIIMVVLRVAVSVIIAKNFFINWRKSLLEVEELKQEKIKTGYQALQNQLNPHFLFNNFNMLLSEIRRDPDNAIQITEKLSDVYRYVLECKDRDTVSLKEETEFIQSIIFLYKVRFADNMTVEVQIPTEVQEYRLPPLTIQILLENAIKHNIVSTAHPLYIHISVDRDTLVVANNLQPRKATYSTGLGLKKIFLFDRPKSNGKCQ